MMKQWSAVLFVLATSVFAMGCAADSAHDLGKAQGSASQANPLENPSNFFKSVAAVTVEVAYEPGAEPYAGNTASGQPFWRLSEDNLKALYQGRPNVPSFTVPKTLAEMHSIPAQNKASWSPQDIFDLSLDYREGVTTEQHGYLWVVFLNGNDDDGSGTNPAIVGVNILGTSVIAVFKSVVNASAPANSATAKYLEQSTVVHEIGHALGLVNGGLTMQAAHEDASHSHHCTNPNCVMYWQNEGSSGLSNLIQQIIVSGSNVIFGSECLNDARSF